MTYIFRQRLSDDLMQTIAMRLRYQDIREDSPTYGAYISPEHWLDEAGHTATTSMIVEYGYAILLSERGFGQLPNGLSVADLSHRIDIAVVYLLSVQRPSGFIDLRNTNYDSSPDTAFALQLLCAFLDMTRSETWMNESRPKLEIFCRKALQGLLTGGFHTPNHRWVIVGALSIGHSLFPDIEVMDVIHDYLAETIDIDEDGTYLERSIAVYDAVTNRSLLLYADYLANESERERIYRIVMRNLEFNRYMLHPDGTAETSLSSRQDYGKRPVPTGLIASYLHVGITKERTDFVGMAQFLQVANKPSQYSADAVWNSYVILQYPDVPDMPYQMPDDYSVYFPQNKIWRHRQNALSTTVLGDGTTNLMKLVFGQAQLSALKIAQAYFGVGLFMPDEARFEDQTITLNSSGQQKPHLPAYHLPKGTVVERAEFETSKSQRQHREIPPATSRLTISATTQGYALHYMTLNGLDDVITQIALDFPAGGLWETSDTVVACPEGTILFLKKGSGRMRFGVDVIEIDAGHCVHLDQHMRHSEPLQAGHVRLLLTFVTPVDYQFTIKTYTLLN